MSPCLWNSKKVKHSFNLRWPHLRVKPKEKWSCWERSPETESPLMVHSGYLGSNDWEESSCPNQHRGPSHSGINLGWASGCANDSREPRTILIQNALTFVFHRGKDLLSKHCKKLLHSDQRCISAAVTGAQDGYQVTCLRADKVTAGSTPSCGFSNNCSKWVPGTFWACSSRSRAAKILGRGNKKLWLYQWCQQQMGEDSLFRLSVSVASPV